MLLYSVLAEATSLSVLDIYNTHTSFFSCKGQMNREQFEVLIRPTKDGKMFEHIMHNDNAEELFGKEGCLTRVIRKSKKGTTEYLVGGFIHYVDPNLQYLYVTGLMDTSKQYCYQIPHCEFYVLPKTDPDAEIKYWQKVVSNL